MSTPDEGQVYAQTVFSRPPGATDVLLVRHGRSAPMPAGAEWPHVEGHADPELSEEGREQADRLGERLAKVEIDAIYTSDLRRTIETAAPLARRLGITPVADARLREVFLGEWEGGVFRQREAERHPLMVRLWREGRWDVVPGAEPVERFAARVGDALERCAERHPGGRVVVVCHGGVIGQAIALATGALPLAFVRCDNASISHVIRNEDQWIVRRFNDTAHLGPAFSSSAPPPT